jgi:large subunit ribosomal protein L2
MARDGNILIKMPSGETRLILLTWLLLELFLIQTTNWLYLVKAGRTRWLGRRPRTRPVAMNPIDQMGGEGIADIHVHETSKREPF